MFEFHKEQQRFIYPVTLNFTFEKGEHRGESYRVSLNACNNPLCTCQDVEFVAGSADDGSPGAADAGSRYEFFLDVGERKIAKKRNSALSTTNINFARSFMKELDTKQWNEIEAAFFAFKARLAKNCNIEQIDPPFPMDQIEDEGMMVGWHDVFPFAENILIKDGAAQYLFDDQYCINSTCSCKDVALVIVAIENGVARDGDLSPAVRYNYTTRKWKIETSPADGSSSVGRIMAKLHESSPDISGTLKERHRILRRLYTKYRKKHGFSTAEQPRQKIGRNEPCPCGSGKKYKVCCGQ